MTTFLHLLLTLYSLSLITADNCEFRVYDYADESGIASANEWYRITTQDLQENGRYKNELIDYLNFHQVKVTPIASWDVTSCQIVYNSNRQMVLNSGSLSINQIPYFGVHSCENLAPNRFNSLESFDAIFHNGFYNISVLSYESDFLARNITSNNNNPAFWRKCFNNEYDQLCVNGTVVNGNYHSFLDGTYTWWYFDTITNSPVYYCDECNQFKGVYLNFKSRNQHYYYILASSTTYILASSTTSAGWTHCSLGTNIPSNFINSCDGKWDSFDNDTWNVNLQPCVDTATTTSTTTTSTTTTTTSSSTITSDTNDETVFATTTACGYTLNECISIDLFDSEYYTCDELGGFIHIMWEGTNDCNETRIGNRYKYTKNRVSPHACCTAASTTTTSSSKRNNANIQITLVLFIIEFIISPFIF